MSASGSSRIYLPVLWSNLLLGAEGRWRAHLQEYLDKLDKTCAVVLCPANLYMNNPMHTRFACSWQSKSACYVVLSDGPLPFYCTVCNKVCCATASGCLLSCWCSVMLEYYD